MLKSIQIIILLSWEMRLLRKVIEPCFSKGGFQNQHHKSLLITLNRT
ncbi:N-acetylglutamate synthase mitochondrial [Bienertia sinuspersici]